MTVGTLIDQYYDKKPDSSNPSQQVAFGTSGHRGTSSTSSFNEDHILAITQAVCEYRKTQKIFGPLYIGKDTHALSEPALNTALEVLAANEIHTIIHQKNYPTPTPVISHSILRYNKSQNKLLADGIVVTPSHNPPEYGGFKYNEPHGGPAGTKATTWIEKRANELLRAKNKGVLRTVFNKEHKSSFIHEEDMITPYVLDIESIINTDAIASSGLSLGADPLGGSALPYWLPIAKHFGFNLTVTNDIIDPSFSFMPTDHDGKTRMDCSSPYAMSGLISHANKYDLSFATDPDADRHGIVTSTGLMNSNNFLSVAVWYLLKNRKEWNPSASIGKTCVTTSLINRIVKAQGRNVFETPVGFKWFVPDLFSGNLLFGGEESAGAVFLRKKGNVWTTDKDGIILCLLAAEIMAVTEKSPSDLYKEITNKYGTPFFERSDAPISDELKKAFKVLQPESVNKKELAGDLITDVATHASGNSQPIGGLKVSTSKGWFAARPSGTEPLYKIYAESFESLQHLKMIQDEAQQIISSCL